MRRSILAFAVAISLVAIGAGPAEVAAQNASTTIDFVQNGIGVPPADFEFWRTERGSPGDWAVVRDTTASAGAAIEQSSRDVAENRYPLAIYKPVSLKDVEISASIKVISGAAPTAGIAVRLMNPGNYYVVAANALEGRVDLYRFSDGRRERIAGTEADVARNHWQTLRVEVEGDHITVSLDEQLLFKAWDRGFLKDGHVALWTEEDTVARFDRIEITDHPWSERD
jgi:glycosyl hydrolase family 59 (putative galactocerebrosidase)